MPALHPKRILRRVQVVTMDQDAQQNLAFELNTGRPGTIFPLAVLRLCTFHLIARNFFDLNKIRLLIDKVRDACPIAKAELEIVRQMWWAIIKFTETTEEMVMMNQAIVAFISDILLQRLIRETTDPHTKINAHTLHTKVQDFYCNKIWPNASRYCNPHFKHKMHLGVTTSNACETEFSVLKSRHHNRVLPLIHCMCHSSR